MNKPKSDEQPPAPQSLPTPKVESSPKAVGLPRRFRDTVFTSRTLITPNGESLVVIKGVVTADTSDHYEFLQNHPDLEPAPE
ncbi:hypothetical protein YA0871_21955 [Pseudomonas paralactis]|uniref:Uncharacterized protein n=1 Tax=Pseudomonas paralactis TaxID=1615673 RepID=A0ABS0V4V7_9PSED|nr:hypothetical protein [Pseudomonas paralactis]MBI6635329.1 hypothetical protein [Pseudomonas paralactis]